MAFLGILFGVLIVAVMIGQFLLYRKSDPPTPVLIYNGLLGVLLSWLIFTSLPTNYDGQQLISLVWGLIALIGLAIRFAGAKYAMISKVLLTIAAVGGLIQLIMG